MSDMCRDEAPDGIDVRVWAGACALAMLRHPSANYPHPLDVRYAETVLAAIWEPQAKERSFVRRMRLEWVDV